MEKVIEQFTQSEPWEEDIFVLGGILCKSSNPRRLDCCRGQLEAKMTITFVLLGCF
ncbi:hypothetical protein HBHAL_2456 [Halobacillus halophilus DSM 2266]|uniref:Uncharacterized protein n=1 Tax=Halobacillus halophilus (strain ATCC 35676 / DSM 2266 / JCM 20832 / KCTC 3685 / LMG 17431 / NBRC 102448 / NCIMB 2269) TaxID=866895 RepID=I0JKY0_HALH3|nr:hypothetical protein HBHAL_2456 [Halobacillus halophilus DSM 2266]